MTIFPKNRQINRKSQTKKHEPTQQTKKIVS